MNLLKNLTRCAAALLAIAAVSAFSANASYLYKTDYSDGPFDYTILHMYDHCAQLSGVNTYAFTLYKDGTWHPEDIPVGIWWDPHAPDYPTDMVIPSHVEIEEESYEVIRVHDECFKGIEYIRSLELPPAVHAIDYEAFKFADIKHIRLPENLDSIGMYAFTHSNMRSMIFPDKIQLIPKHAMSEMPYLHTVVFGKNVNYLSYWTFDGVFNLKELYIMSPEPPSVIAGPFADCFSPDATVYVPEESLAKYPRRPEDKRGEMSDTWATTWAFFHDFRPIPDLFVVVDDEEMTIPPTKEDRLFTTVVNYADVTVYSDKWEYDPTMLTIDGDKIIAGENMGVTTVRRVIETSTGTYKSKPITININPFPSGVEGIDNDSTPNETVSAADHCFFTIDGMPAGSDADRLAPGIYIERDHGKTRKFIKH